MNFSLKDYEITNLIGKGGMGEVYLAKDLKLGRKVAIKVLKLSDSLTEEQKKEIISRFKREAKSIAQLKHNNIVSMYELGEENNEHYMVMEFLEGKSIGTIIEEEGLIPIDKCIDISIQVCKAMTYVHSQSIIHRDIKPDNIILVDEKIVKLTDFGIAKSEVDELKLTQDNSILGSVMYISPEQLRSSKNVDNKADIYSFGVSFYQMVTGKLPYDGETVGEVVSKILGSENPPMPRVINKNIPFELEAVILKAMNKNKEKRYQGFEDMERDLLSIQAGHSFRKTTISNDKSMLGDLKNTTVNQIPKETKIEYNSAKIIETASLADKLITNVFRLVFLTATTYLLFNTFYSFFVSTSVLELSEKLNYTNIQGPSSKYMLHLITFKRTLIFSIFFNLVLTTIIGFLFPMDSKGITRKYKFSSEIIAIIILPIILAGFTFITFKNKDTMNDYLLAYKETQNTEIKSINEITDKKGKLFLSKLMDYKREFAPMYGKLKFDDSVMQLKNMSITTDYIHLSPNRKNVDINDPILLETKDLLENVFNFPSPEKELYYNKLIGIITKITNNNIVIPDNLNITTTKNEGKTDSTMLSWENNSILLNKDKITIKYNNEEIVYPKNVENNKNIEYKIQNDTDQIAYVFIYEKNEYKSSLTLKPRSSEKIVANIIETELLVLTQKNTFLPYYAKFYPKQGDILLINKLYSETEKYYKLQVKDFTNNSTEEISKLELNEKGILNTSDADISKLKLVDFTK
ncbi:MAG: serine/threonine-protein kinase [Candidatus Sericytochromatia bacterium]